MGPAAPKYALVCVGVKQKFVPFSFCPFLCTVTTLLVIVLFSSVTIILYMSVLLYTCVRNSILFIDPTTCIDFLIVVVGVFTPDLETLSTPQPGSQL
jgi:hypothetical protein